MKKNVLAVLLLGISQVTLAGFVPVDFSSLHNSRMQDYDSSGAPAFPEGSQNLAGVLFNIPVSGKNVWNSTFQDGDNPRQIDIDVDVLGVTRVYSLINTFWGKPGETLAAIEFRGKNGAFFRKDLEGNVDIRDYNQNNFTNDINGTTTQVAYDSPDEQTRLDMVTIDLPDVFLTDILDTISVIDNGANGEQRIFLAGMTLDQFNPEAAPVPLPAGFGLFVLSIFGLLKIRRIDS